VGAVAILRVLSTWRPVPGIPINVPVNPDWRTYAALVGLLALMSGFLFGLVPVRQVLRADPCRRFRPRQCAQPDAARRAAGSADRHVRGSGNRLAGGGAGPDVMRRRAQLVKAVRDIAFDLDRKDVYPSAKQILSVLPNGYTGGWKFLHKAIVDSQEEVRRRTV
jgi:hypothetical protein